MLKQRQEQIGFVVRVADILICIAAFFLAYRFRGSFYFSHLKPMGSIDTLTWFLAASIVLHFFTYPILGFYHSLRLKPVHQIIFMVFKAALAEFVILGSLIFIFQEKATSRYFFGFFLAFNYGLILVERLGGRLILSSLRKRGYNFRQVLIVGTGPNARGIITSLRRNKHWGYVPSGILLEDGTRAVKEVEGIPVIGRLAELEELVTKKTVDEIYFAVDRVDPEAIADQVMLCERLGIPARLPLGFFDLSRSKVTFGTLDQVPVITFYTTLKTPVETTLKRVLDVVVAIIGLFFTTLLFPWIAFMIKRESSGPVIFKQVRVGENGRRFKCYKFRTMVIGAEARKAELLKDNKMQGPLFKMENDPRVTRFGAFLRRTSLDEFPQFFNILRGDMSVVGTRPPTPDEVTQYRTHFRRRLSIRPGLTGLWQVSGRNKISRFEDVLALDLHYIDNWTLWLDLRIICKTLWVALFRRGAL